MVAVTIGLWPWSIAGMGNGVILTWSVENVISVTLMALAGYLVFAALSQFVRQGGSRAILQTVTGQM